MFPKDFIWRRRREEFTDKRVDSAADVNLYMWDCSGCVNEPVDEQTLQKHSWFNVSVCLHHINSFQSFLHTSSICIFHTEWIDVDVRESCDRNVTDDELETSDVCSERRGRFPAVSWSIRSNVHDSHASHQHFCNTRRITLHVRKKRRWWVRPARQRPLFRLCSNICKCDVFNTMSGRLQLG